jgi:hypothetical protein
MRLAATLPDGSTLRDHLHAAAAAGMPADVLLLSRAPGSAAAIWEAFVALNAARPVGMGPSAIPPSELLAWQQLHGVCLSPWEAETLLAMDRAALAAYNKSSSHKGH